MTDPIAADRAASEPRPGLLLRMIDFYQRAFAGRPSPCRFTPGCSSYAREALEVYGTWRGTWLTVRRLLRCRPFGPSGFDPVPVPERHRNGRGDQHSAGSPDSRDTTHRSLLTVTQRN